MSVRALKESSPESGRKTNSGETVDGTHWYCSSWRKVCIPSPTTKSPRDDAKSKSLGKTQSPIPWDDAKSNPRFERCRVQLVEEEKWRWGGLTWKLDTGWRDGWEVLNWARRSGLCVYLYYNICSLSTNPASLNPLAFVFYSVNIYMYKLHGMHLLISSSTVPVFSPLLVSDFSLVVLRLGLCVSRGSIIIWLGLCVGPFVPIPLPFGLAPFDVNTARFSHGLPLFSKASHHRILFPNLASCECRLSAFGYYYYLVLSLFPDT